MTDKTPWVRLESWDGATAFHSVRTGPDQWIGSGTMYSGVRIDTRKTLISELAAQIRAALDGPVRPEGAPPIRIPVRLETAEHGLDIDPLANTWLDGEYLPPDVYLPKVIPA